MMLCPQLVSVPPGDGVPVPAGIIVGYEGTVASLGGYPDWDLCDGINGTPDLSDKFIIGSGGGYTLNDTGGAQTGQVTGTTSTEGGHGNIGGLGADGGGASSQYDRGVSGAHAHAITADMDWLPPSRQLVYIRANTETKLPPNGVAWRYDAATPSGFALFEDAAGRFLIGRTDDARTQVGDDNRNITSVQVGTEGSHLHAFNNITGSAAAGNSHPNAAGGAHVHTNPSDEVLPVPKPPYLVLLCIRSVSKTGAGEKFIAAYNGLLGNLPADWHLCDGLNGTPDMGGRIPLAKDGVTAIGETGGSLDPVPITGGAVPSAAPVHNHSSGDGTLTGSLSDHSNHTWTHDHASWSGDADPTPPYHCLHYVMYAGV